MYGVKQLLNQLKIGSRLERKRRAGTIMVIRGKAFLKRRTSYNLALRKTADIRLFAKEVGFSILRKSSKLSDALALDGTVAPVERPKAWTRLYIKSRGEWVSREFERDMLKGIKVELAAHNQSGQ